MLLRRSARALAVCRSQMAPRERHTLCHDVIQGTAHPDDLVPFQGHRCLLRSRQRLL
jgi:hypothetical protein